MIQILCLYLCVAFNVSGNVFRKKTKKNKLKDHGKEEIAHLKETNVTVQDEKHSEGEEVKTTTNQNNVSHANAGNDGKQSNNE
jgi:hypothetical protein